MMTTPEKPIVPFDNYEISGCKRFIQDDNWFVEQVDDSEATFWSLYGHIPGRGVDCIGDFQTRALAEEMLARINPPAQEKLLSSLQALLVVVDAEIEQRQHSGNDEDWASLKALSDGVHAVVREGNGGAA
jgi:hypothetical protein